MLTISQRVYILHATPTPPPPHPVTNEAAGQNNSYRIVHCAHKKVICVLFLRISCRKYETERFFLHYKVILYLKWHISEST